MATSKDLNRTLNIIADTLGLATSRQEAKDMSLDSFLYLEYAACYGGYRVVTVKLENGAHYGALGQSSSCSRMKAKEMDAFLTGVLAGISVEATNK